MIHPRFLGEYMKILCINLFKRKTFFLLNIFRMINKEQQSSLFAKYLLNWSMRLHTAFTQEHINKRLQKLGIVLIQFYPK